LQDKQNDPPQDFSSPGHEDEYMSLEQDVLSKLAGTGKLHVHKSTRWWSQVKTAAAAVYSNRHYLSLYREYSPERLAENVPGGPEIIDDVFIDPKAVVDPTAVVSFDLIFFFLFTVQL
jgi:mannose-1-phosphate guanylyltransferase